MGTLFSLKRLLEQWKTVVICLAGLAGMCGLAWVVCPLFMDKALVITGLPPLAGGIVATTIMQKAANDLGLTSAAVFAISMYCIQGFAGYPLTAVCLKREAQRLLKDYREGRVEGVSKDATKIVAESIALPDGGTRAGLLASLLEYAVFHPLEARDCRLDRLRAWHAHAGQRGYLGIGDGRRLLPPRFS